MKANRFNQLFALVLTSTSLPAATWDGGNGTWDQSTTKKWDTGKVWSATLSGVPSRGDAIFSQSGNLVTVSGSVTGLDDFALNNTTISGGSLTLLSGSGSGSSRSLNGSGTISSLLAGGTSANDTLKVRSNANIVLAGANTYGAKTAVESSGRLTVNGDQSGATSLVTVDSGGTLAGAGVIGGATTVNGTLTGALTFNENLTFGTGSIFDWSIDNAGMSSSGEFALDSALLLGSGTFDVTLGDDSNAFWNTDQSWTFAGVTNLSAIFTTLTGDFVATSGGRGFSLTNSSLQWSAVPEPSSALAGILIASGLMRRRR